MKNDIEMLNLADALDRAQAEITNLRARHEARDETD